MKTLIGSIPAELEDALYSLAVGDHGPGASDIDALVREFPDYAEYITDTLVALAVDDDPSEGEDAKEGADNVSSTVSRVMSRFNNRLYEVQSLGVVGKEPRYAAAGNLFEALTRDDLRAIAVRLNANTVFLLKLRDRLIDPETMSDGFRSVVAKELAAPVDVVIAYFGGPPVVAARASYKAETKPVALKRQTFKEAVAKSGLNESRQSYLLSL